MRIKTVIMSHDSPESTAALYRSLCDEMDVTVIDSGSGEGRRPRCPAEIYPNLFYTGCWREAMRRFGHYDVLWVIGGDVTAENPAVEYRQAIETAYPFGIWSPSISGYCREIMSKSKCQGRVINAYHVEGIAIAISRDMMEQIGFRIPDGSRLGWGVDLWMSWIGWTSMMRNIIDGRVSLRHPESCGYSREEARMEMDTFMVNAIGNNWIRDARAAPALGRFDNNVRGVILEGQNV